MTMTEHTQILGAAIEPVLKAFLSEATAAKMLKDGLGIETLSTQAYYPALKYIKTLDLIRSKVGDAVLRKVGLHIMTSAKWPPNVTNLEGALASIDVAYHMNHRPNENIGHYKFQKISDKHFKIICDNPYPCAFDLGIITGVAQAFSPKAMVFHEKNSCRAQGQPICEYSIKLT